MSQALSLLGEPGWSGALFAEGAESERRAELTSEEGRARVRVWDGEELMLEALVPRCASEARARAEIEPLAGAWAAEAAQAGLSPAGAKARCASLLIQSLRPMRLKRMEMSGPARARARLGA